MATGKDAAIVLGAAGAVGIIGYVAYSSFHQGPPGGSCDCSQDPGSPCCQALAPYRAEYQTCLNQYTALWAEVVKGGQAPTPSQQAALDSFKQCMNDAAKNIAVTAKDYIPQNAITSLIDSIGEGLLIVAVGIAAMYGLRGLGGFISQRRASGSLSTKPGSPAGIAALMSDGMVQYAAANGLVSLEAVSQFRNSVNANASFDILNASNYFTFLAQLHVFDSALANAQLGFYTSTINVDAFATVNFLALV